MLKFPTSVKPLQYNLVLETLQDYMLTASYLNKCTRHKLVDLPKSKPLAKPIAPKKSPIMKPNDTFFVPRLTDSLFWCYYVGLHSKYAFDIIGNKHFSKEKDEKFAYVSRVRSSKDVLKANKIKPLTDVENSLANQPTIDRKTVIALAIIDKQNLLLIDGKKCYETLNNDSDDFIVIHKKDGNYVLETGVTKEAVTKYRTTYYTITTFDNGLKAMSGYKVEELETMCDKLGVNLEKVKSERDKKKLLKKDLYELVVQSLS